MIFQFEVVYDRGGEWLATAEGGDRVPGNEEHRSEDDEGNSYEDYDGLEEPLEHISSHGCDSSDGRRAARPRAWEAGQRRHRPARLSSQGSRRDKNGTILGGDEVPDRDRWHGGGFVSL